MKENYSAMCENILNNLNDKKKLLLHSCCGPCSSYVISYLTKYFDITILYYNPNIFPYDEYLKRKEEQIKLINEIDKVNCVDIIDCDYDNDYYNECIKDYDFFCTTLSVSPYKNAEWINNYGKELENKYNVKWLYSDFKKKDGYKSSILLSNKYNLYRQNYCGCIYSKPQ